MGVGSRVRPVLSWCFSERKKPRVAVDFALGRSLLPRLNGTFGPSSRHNMSELDGKTISHDTTTVRSSYFGSFENGKIRTNPH